MLVVLPRSVCGIVAIIVIGRCSIGISCIHSWIAIMTISVIGVIAWVVLMDVMEVFIIVEEFLQGG